VDLRKRFGIPPLEAEKEHDSRIVIVETDGLTAGLIVDGVSEVLRLSQDRIDPPSHLVATAESECVVGIGRIASNHTEDAAARSRGGDAASQDRLMVLLDVRKILDQALVDGMGEAASRKAA
jgi:chemotaxis signal transduction protein